MQAEINDLTEAIIGAAIEVHRVLGPGLLESAYQRALAYELGLKRLTFEEQCPCPVKYKTMTIEDAYRLDFLVERQVVVEIKSIDSLESVHDAQVLSYLRFTGCRVGLLFNFRSRLLMKQGLRRFVL